MKFVKFALCIMVVLLLAGNVYADDFATTVISSSAGLDGSGWYNDPADLLGKPAQYCEGSSAGVTDHISIVEPAWGDGYITTFNEGDWAIVKFDHRVMDDPNNPYDLDFIVYSNAMFKGFGYVSDTTNHGAYNLEGSINDEPLKISVSQYGTDWYTYDIGPYGDTLYPTNPWEWDQSQYDSTGNGWTSVENDFTMPLNPNDPDLSLANLTSGTSADAMDLYAGSAGGTGFDLDPSGYDWIEYIKVEGLSGYAGGEIDAFADVAAVPIPGAVWLLVSTMLGLIGSKKYFFLE